MFDTLEYIYKDTYTSEGLTIYRHHLLAPYTGNLVPLVSWNNSFTEFIVRCFFCTAVDKVKFDKTLKQFSKSELFKIKHYCRNNIILWYAFEEEPRGWFNCYISPNKIYYQKSNQINPK